jgi:hypothetical protein
MSLLYVESRQGHTIICLLPCLDDKQLFLVFHFANKWSIETRNLASKFSWWSDPRFSAET